MKKLDLKTNIIKTIVSALFAVAFLVVMNRYDIYDSNNDLTLVGGISIVLFVMSVCCFFGYLIFCIAGIRSNEERVRNYDIHFPKLQPSALKEIAVPEISKWYEKRILNCCIYFFAIIVWYLIMFMAITDAVTYVAIIFLSMFWVIAIIYNVYAIYKMNRSIKVLTKEQILIIKDGLSDPEAFHPVDYNLFAFKDYILVYERDLKLIKRESIRTVRFDISLHDNQKPSRYPRGSHIRIVYNNAASYDLERDIFYRFPPARIQADGENIVKKILMGTLENDQ